MRISTMARRKGAVILFAMLALASQYAFAQLPIETRQLRLQGASSGQAVGFRLPLTPIANYNLTYPAAIGAGPGSFMFLQSVTNTSEGSFAWSNAPQATGWTPRWNATTSVIEWIDPDGEFNPNWSIRGNNFGTTTSRIFGTTSGAEIDIRTNNLNRMTIESDGDITINTTAGAGSGLSTTIGRTTESHITAINGTTNIQGTTTINADNNTAVTNIGTGTTTGAVTIGGGSDQTIAIGTGAAVKTVSLGSNTTTSSTTILGGTGGALNANVDALGSATNIGSGNTTGTITIGGDGAQIVSVGNGAAAKTVNLGSNNTTSTTTILSGATGALNVNVDNNSPTNINTGTSTGAVSIGNTAALNVTVLAANASINAAGGAGVTNIGTGNTTGTVTIGGDAAQTIAIGASPNAAKTVSIGSSNGSSVTTIVGGTGNVNINTTGSSRTNIGNSGASGSDTRFSGEIQMETDPGDAGDVLISSGVDNTPQWKNLNDAIGIRAAGNVTVNDNVATAIISAPGMLATDAILITLQTASTTSAVIATVTGRDDIADTFTVTFSAQYTGVVNYLVIKTL